MNVLISLVIAYLIGSISFAVVIAKILKTADPRTIGSRNAGATNILRNIGAQAALYVLLGDGLKGLIAVLIARYALHVHGILLGFVALAVVLGHVFPLYFKFKGGKGVATMVGALLGLAVWVGIFVILTWVIVTAIFRYVSVGSLAAAVAAPLYLLISGHFDYFFPVLLIAALIVWKHWNNIERLRQGTESKIKLSEFMSQK